MMYIYIYRFIYLYIYIDIQTYRYIFMWRKEIHVINTFQTYSNVMKIYADYIAWSYVLRSTWRCRFWMLDPGKLLIRRVASFPENMTQPDFGPSRKSVDLSWRELTPNSHWTACAIPGIWLPDVPCIAECGSCVDVLKTLSDGSSLLRIVLFQARCFEIYIGRSFSYHVVYLVSSCFP